MVVGPRLKRKVVVRVARALRVVRLLTLERYLLKQFLSTLLVSLLISTSVFLVFDFFERVTVFFREDASFFQAFAYIFYKIPLVIHLMMPVAVLVSVLFSVGRLSQLSEITAMRACGVSLLTLARPLLFAGLIISGLMLLAGETIVPWSTRRVDDLYQLDIQKKAEKGRLNRTNFWHRSGNKFYSVAFYDSSSSTLNQMAIFEMDPVDFRLLKRLDVHQATWKGGMIGWVMSDVIETTFAPTGQTQRTHFAKLPLVIPERPKDFYSRRTKPEALSYLDLKYYIRKLQNEGVPVTNYQVDLAAKLSFPVVNFILILVAFPFALMTARAGTMSRSFIIGVSTGFTYYFVHALSLSLGSGELIPILPAAWTANILLGCLGGYLILGAEHAR